MQACHESVSRASRHLIDTAEDPSQCEVHSKRGESSYLSPTCVNITPDPVLLADSFLSSPAYLLATEATVHLPSCE